MLLLLHQARQDILAQDLAEAIDSQVELAEQLRSYREENEQLLRDKKKVCLFLFCFFPSVVTVTGPGNVTQIQPVISDGKSPTQHHDGQKYQLLLGELLLPNTNINKP